MKRVSGYTVQLKCNKESSRILCVTNSGYLCELHWADWLMPLVRVTLETKRPNNYVEVGNQLCCIRIQRMSVLLETFQAREGVLVHCEVRRFRYNCRSMHWVHVSNTLECAVHLHWAHAFIKNGKTSWWLTSSCNTDEGELWFPCTRYKRTEAQLQTW